MQIFSNKIIFSPTDIVRFFESEFASYMDHFEKMVPKEIIKEQGIHRDPADPLYAVIVETGKNHENSVLTELEKKSSIIKIERDKYDKKACIEQTISAMKEGANKIYQAAIQTDMIFGYADLLEKTKGDSRLGNYHYVPYDIKISSHPTPSAIVQLCCYCDILEKIQDIRPEHIKIITKDKTIHTFRTNQFFYFYRAASALQGIGLPKRTKRLWIVPKTGLFS